MDREPVVKALNQAGVAVRRWDGACVYATSHTLEFAGAVAEAEREACADACTNAEPLGGASPRSVVSCCTAAILGRP